METNKAAGGANQTQSSTFYLKKRGGPHHYERDHRVNYHNLHIPVVTARSTISNGTLNQANTGGTFSAGGADIMSQSGTGAVQQMSGLPTGGLSPTPNIAHERAISVNYRRSTVYHLEPTFSGGHQQELLVPISI